MTNLDQQATELSARLATIDRRIEQLRGERLRIYSEWQHVMREIGNRRNLEQKAMQAQHAPCEGLQHFGHHDDPMQWEEEQHANKI